MSAELLDRFALCVRGARHALSEMSPSDQLAAVTVNVEDLIRLYLEVAEVQHEFHWACERGKAPRIARA
jgi:hypothetical protein